MNVYSGSNQPKANRIQGHKSKSGYLFDFHSNQWQLDGSMSINFSRLRQIDSVTAQGFRQALCRYAEELSACHTNNVFAYFNMYCDHAGAKTINVKDLTNYRASLAASNEYKLGALKGFLLAWQEWGFKGVDADVAGYLEELILRGNPKGNAVKGGCPYSGPLTHNELGSLIEWAANAFTARTIHLKEYAYFMALALTGRRPGQIRALRSEDLMVREDSKGHDFVINCPRAKQRDGGFREQFTPLPINEDLYLVLHNQRNRSIQLIEKSLKQKLSVKLQEQVPIFLDESRVDRLHDIEDFELKLKDTPDFLHITKMTAAESLRRISQLNTACSERTGEFVNFSALRFRYTKGTNLSRRGIRGVALAMALDHTDTQQIGVYVENTEETAQQIDEIMAPIMAPLAQAFAGKLINSERDAIRAKDPNSRVKNGRSNNVGSCGTHSFCVSGYRSCYTCACFQPWLEAPHEEVLLEILTERQRQKEVGVSPFVIQSTDRLLLSVQQVILMCKAENEKRCTINV